MATFEETLTHELDSLLEGMAPIVRESRSLTASLIVDFLKTKKFLSLGWGEEKYGIQVLQEVIEFDARDNGLMYVIVRLEDE